MNSLASTMVNEDMLNEQQRFTQLYLEHVQTVTKFARRLCDQEENVEDLVQETFLNAFRGHRRFRGDSKLSTWLYAIAARVCSRMHRKHAGEPSRLVSLEDVEAAHDAVMPTALQKANLTPEEEAQQAQFRRQLERAVTLLPPHYQSVLLLRYIDGLSTRSVSIRLGLGEPAVKSRLHRARQFVRRRLTGAGWNVQDVSDRMELIAGSCPIHSVAIRHSGGQAYCGRIPPAPVSIL